MAHKIVYDAETRIIETEFQGRITLNEMKEFLPELMKIAKEKESFLVLSDFLEASLVFPITDIYFFPKNLSDAVAPLGISAYQFKRALVTPKNKREFSFGETVSVNRGQNIRLFEDVDEAKNG